jgi:hypothetical protein
LAHRRATLAWVASMLAFQAFERIAAFAKRAPQIVEVFERL